MSDGRAAPAGWYPDPNDAAAQRWWDGAQWTEHRAAAPVTAYPAAPAYVPAAEGGRPAPYGGAEAARMPEGTPVDTLWIWLIVALPVLAALPIFFWDLEAYVMSSMSVDASANPVLAALGPYTDPWYLALMFGSWIAYGLVVWFAYLDYAALRRLGYARRFHWAWAFLSSLVYVIGRSVVVRGQAGRGFLPMAAAIALSVVLTIGVVTWVAVMMVNLFSSSMEMYSSY
ncbi:DUF2510 domain-containing protein [Agromyces laixinhei]|uniref:DUF2510 domain-containing protein n=1 Tax=Agromyces laixinhei TaxID=2585717 RepID=UPI00143E0AE1|nr:DUF2510 domain-containing protein [Agromyces laixinhei]